MKTKKLSNFEKDNPIIYISDGIIWTKYPEFEVCAYLNKILDRGTPNNSVEDTFCQNCEIFLYQM